VPAVAVGTAVRMQAGSSVRFAGCDGGKCLGARGVAVLGFAGLFAASGLAPRVAFSFAPVFARKGIVQAAELRLELLYAF